MVSSRVTRNITLDTHEILTGDDRVQLLLRNARQILAIVKATFPSETFDNPFAKIDCKEFSSSGRELACKWLGVTDVFRNSGGLTPPPDVVVPVLLDVSITFERLTDLIWKAEVKFSFARLLKP